MPTITVMDGRTRQHSAEVEDGKRLVLAIEDSGTPIGHRCGGNARCTTCRVQFVAGEPQTMTEAEYNILHERGLLGQVRLSCQVVCDHDMTVRPKMTAENQPGWNGDTGPRPLPTVQPKAEWHPIDELLGASRG